MSEDGYSYDSVESVELSESEISSIDSFLDHSTQENVSEDETTQKKQEEEEDFTSSSDDESLFDPYSKQEVKKEVKDKEVKKETRNQFTSPTYNFRKQIYRFQNFILPEDIWTRVDDDQRQTFPVLTIFEKTRILGERASQILHNSPIYANVDEAEAKKMTSMEIAIMELEQGKLPLMITRLLPNKFYEEWKLSQLKIE